MRTWTTPERERDTRPVFWPALAFALVVLAAIAVEIYATERVLAESPEVTLAPLTVAAPSALYYGTPRDTSAVARVCCRVSR